MTDSKRITEILKAYTKKNNISASSVILEEYAEELLANGVIVPPCKVYDEVWCIVFSPSADKLVVKRGFVDEIKIKHENLNIKIVDCVPVKYANLNITVNENDFGKTVFLTKEEAEAKLKELG